MAIGSDVPFGGQKAPAFAEGSCVRLRGTGPQLGPRLRGDTRSSRLNFVRQENPSGWDGWIRTTEWRDQNPLPYHLATPHPITPLLYRLWPTARAGRRPPVNP